jgi:hypothetical protein
MPITFPDEDEIRAKLQQHLAAYFDYSERLLQFWVLADKDKKASLSALSPIVLRVLLAMSVKSCRQFRTVIELCERGENADAAIVARAMFETALVVGFILKPRFVPREFDKKGKVKRSITVPNVKLTREFRAILFAAHDALKPDREAAMHAQRPGMKRHAKRMAKIATMTNVGQSYIQTLGPQWTSILMNRPYTYTGLSIANLARSLGKPFPQWYDQVYGPQSEHVHAGDLFEYLAFDEVGNTLQQWHGTVGHVRGTLLTAITMFYTLVGLLDHHIRFGVTFSTQLDSFARTYKKLIQEWRLYRPGGYPAENLSP